MKVKTNIFQEETFLKDCLQNKSQYQIHEHVPANTVAYGCETSILKIFTSSHLN